MYLARERERERERERGRWGMKMQEQIGGIKTDGYRGRPPRS